jgi:hypothetical protein
MAVRATCPGCQGEFLLDEQLAGKVIRCAQCKQAFKVPAAPAASEDRPPVVLALAEETPPIVVVDEDPRQALQVGARPAVPSAFVHPPRPAPRAPRRPQRWRDDEPRSGLPVGLLVAGAVGLGLLLLVGAAVLDELLFADRYGPRHAADGPPPVAVAPPPAPAPGDGPPVQPKVDGPMVWQNRPPVFIEPGPQPPIFVVPPVMEVPPPVLGPPPAAKPADVKVPTATAPREALGGVPRRVGDLTVTDLRLGAAKLPRCLFWSADGRVFYALETDGVLRRVALDGFVEEKRLDLRQRCSWLSPSAEGLLVTLPDLQEVWLVDPERFVVKRRVPVPAVTRAISAPVLSVAFAGGNGGGVSVLDLKKGEVVRQYAPMGFEHAALTADGRQLFVQAGIEQLVRYVVRGTRLEPGGSSPRIAQNGQAIEVSPDGRFVCLPSGGGNYADLPNHPAIGTSYSTYVYPASDVTRPAFLLASGAYPRAVGFDPRLGLVYAQNCDKQLIVFTDRGVKQREYQLAVGRGPEVSQFVPHPGGGRLLVLTGEQLYFVDLGKRGR